MKTRILFRLGLVVGLACLVSAPDAHGQLSDNRLEFVNQVQASASDAQFGIDRPLDLILVFDSTAWQLPVRRRSPANENAMSGVYAGRV